MPLEVSGACDNRPDTVYARNYNDRISHVGLISMYDFEVLNLQSLSFSNRNRALFAILVTIT
jgi:hypothetical protein